jgi:hypothetical protein
MKINTSDKQDGMQKPKRKRPPHLWKKGQSGNPKGRAPNTHTIPEILRELAARKLPNGYTSLQQAMETVIARAIAGDHKFTEFLADRTEGKIPQTINQRIDTVPLNITVKSEQEKKVLGDAITGVNGL